jgi:hypothetical protein
MGIDLQHKTPGIRFEDLKIPEPVFNDHFIEFLQHAGISFSNGQKYRVNRSHGHTVHDVSRNCNKKIEKPHKR